MTSVQQIQLPLFVYGTLMSGERAYGRFSHAVEHSAPATLAGTALYSLGSYPMAVSGDGVVTGEVHWLAPEAHDRVLAQLDEYEACSELAEEGVGIGYARVQVTVQLTMNAGERAPENEQQVQAWAYLGLNHTAEQYPKIESGDWRTYRAGRDA